MRVNMHATHNVQIKSVEEALLLVFRIAIFAIIRLHDQFLNAK